MSTKIPPAPIGSLPGSTYWNDWYDKIRNLINNNLINHNSLLGLQGGITGQYYHPNSAQYTALGTAAVIATTAASGFHCIPTCARA